MDIHPDKQTSGAQGSESIPKSREMENPNYSREIDGLQS
jgi:hypothetical protein